MYKTKKFLPILLFIVGITGYLIFQLVIDQSIALVGDSEVISGNKKTIEKLYNDTQLQSVTGSLIDLEKEKAPIVMLNFWASWCGGCLEEMPSLVEMKKKFSDSKVKVVAINTDSQDIESVITKFQKRFALNFPVVSDADGSISRDFDVTALPVTYIFKKGRLIKVHKGAKDFASIEMLNFLQSETK